MNNAKLNYCCVLHSNTRNHLTVCKQINSGSFKNFIWKKIRLQHHSIMVRVFANGLEDLDSIPG